MDVAPRSPSCVPRVARALLLAFVFLVATELACTTTVINFSVDAGSGDLVKPVVDASKELPSPPEVGAELPSRDVAGEMDAGLSFEAAADGGAFYEGAARYVQFSCCASAGGSDCTTQVLGGPLACTEIAYAKSNAAIVCEGRGKALFSYEPLGRCTPIDATRFPAAMGRARFAQYKCCPPISGNCVVEVQGDESVCKDTADWTAQLQSYCEALGGKLGSIGFNQPC